MYGPAGNPSASSGSAGSTDPAARNQRYNYLTGRLRNRQITMEEATELFNLMQAMIARANDLARATAYRSSGAPTPSAAASGPPPPPPRLATAGSSADDLLLVGILAMGAGAGLLAALSKRMGDASPPTPSGNGRSTSSTASR